MSKWFNYKNVLTGETNGLNPQRNRRFLTAVISLFRIQKEEKQLFGTNLPKRKIF